LLYPKLLRIGFTILLARAGIEANPEKLASGEAMPENSDPTPSTDRVPDPNEKLIKVFDSEQDSEAMVVKGLLDSAGIDSDLTSVDAVQDMFPGVGGMVILVREEDAEEARRVIKESLESPESPEVMTDNG
jgi:Putative prokaryotic signal transducing protein